jgi:hypothetical protein
MRPQPSPLSYCLLASAAILGAGSQPLRLNVIYECGPGSPKFKILSCTGPNDDAQCEVQSYTGAEPGPHTRSTREAVLISLKHCHPENRPAQSASSKAAFKTGDTLEVFLFGEWTKSELLAIDRNQYNVRLPDGAKYWMPAAKVRRAVPPTPAGQPPKPGLTSCAGKIDGKYSSSSGFPSIVFRSGKASVQDDEAVECWTGGGKIYLHTPGTRAEQDFVMGINNDGTLDTPVGEIKKKN